MKAALFVGGVFVVAGVIAIHLYAAKYSTSDSDWSRRLDLLKYVPSPFTG